MLILWALISFLQLSRLLARGNVPNGSHLHMVRVSFYAFDFYMLLNTLTFPFNLARGIYCDFLIPFINIFNSVTMQYNALKASLLHNFENLYFTLYNESKGLLCQLELRSTLPGAAMTHTIRLMS